MSRFNFKVMIKSMRSTLTCLFVIGKLEILKISLMHCYFCEDMVF